MEKLIKQKLQKESIDYTTKILDICGIKNEISSINLGQYHIHTKNDIVITYYSLSQKFSYIINNVVYKDKGIINLIKVFEKLQK